MANARSYSDAQLRHAMVTCHSWREVLRHLGLAGTSSASIRSVRRHADRLGLDYAHFRGGRRWDDAQLVEAVQDAASWSEAARRLGLVGGSAVPSVKRHAARLRLDIAHLKVLSPTDGPRELDLAHLSRSGSLIAAAWYSMCGWDVSWPLEPCRYDLMVDGHGQVRRVQVKTTTAATEQGVWQVNVSTTGRGDRRIYTPEEVDDFFVIDGELNFYVIPLEDAMGLHAISLSAYEPYRVRSGTPGSSSTVLPGARPAGAQDPTRSVDASRSSYSVPQRMRVTVARR